MNCFCPLMFQLRFLQVQPWKGCVPHQDVMAWVTSLDTGRLITRKLYLYAGGEWGGWGSIAKCCTYHGKTLKWERVIQTFTDEFKKELDAGCSLMLDKLVKILVFISKRLSGRNFVKESWLTTGLCDVTDSYE